MILSALFNAQQNRKVAHLPCFVAKGFSQEIISDFEGLYAYERKIIKFDTQYGPQ